jgi:creatinine amidohydrolase
MRSGYWRELISGDFPPADRERTIALLPVAAVEQHGPHLPLATDALINEAIVARALVRGVPDVCLLVLPAQQVGHSLEHTAFPGTLSIDAHTLLDAWMELGRSVARAGVGKLVVLNSHGGQGALVDLLAVRLRAESGLLVARTNTWRLGTPPGLFAVDELAHGIHGGELETSLLLHLRPDLVHREALADFAALSARWAAEGRTLGVEGPAGIGWMAQDLNPAGVCGNAAAADAARGERLLEHLAAALLNVVRDLAATPLSLIGR